MYDETIQAWFVWRVIRGLNLMLQLATVIQLILLLLQTCRIRRLCLLMGLHLYIDFV